jgi:hypothetical protein
MTTYELFVVSRREPTAGLIRGLMEQSGSVDGGGDGRHGRRREQG